MEVCMKNVYPVLISKDDDYYLVYIPDLDGRTQGKSFYDAIYMARDYLGTVSLVQKLPEPSDLKTAVQIAREKADDEDFKWSEGTPCFVDIDTVEYKNRLNKKSVKKNCTIPYWLNEKAEAAGVNFSKILQDALIQYLDQ